MDWKVLLIYLEELNSQTQHRNITKKFYGSHTASRAIWNCVYLHCGFFLSTFKLKGVNQNMQNEQKQIEAKICEVLTGKKLSAFSFYRVSQWPFNACITRTAPTCMESQKDQLSLIYRKRRTRSDDIVIFNNCDVYTFLILTFNFL